jgi:hypothetical protein
MPGMVMTTLFYFGEGLGKLYVGLWVMKQKGGWLSSVVPGDGINGEEGAGFCSAGIGDCGLKKPGILLWRADFTLDRLS